MIDVMPEGAALVAERHLSDLLVILQVQGVLDIFTYTSLDTSKNGIILTLKIVVRFPSADL